MGVIINPTWAKFIREKLNNNHEITETISFNKAAQWLIAELIKVNRPYKIVNLGCGVKIITTVTDVCPCCKKKL